MNYNELHPNVDTNFERRFGKPTAGNEKLFDALCNELQWLESCAESLYEKVEAGISDWRKEMAVQDQIDQHHASIDETIYEIHRACGF